jgi:hypothetical protein
MATSRRDSSGAAFVGLGVTFIALGLGRHPSFLVLGIVFLVLGGARLRRSRRP